MKQEIRTNNAPSPIGPYSQAIVAGSMLFISGQIALNPESNIIENTDIQSETHQIMKNLQAILLASGSSFDRVVKSTIFLTDMNNFAQVNEVYGSYFKAPYPARETVEVTGLPKRVNVEISVIALI